MNPTTSQARPTGSKKTILVIGGDSVLRHGLAMIIDRAPDFTVCGQVENAAKAITAVATLRPTAVLVSVLLDGSRGLDSIKTLKSLYPTLPILAAVHAEHLLAVQAMKLGAAGFVVDEDVIGSLRRTLGKVQPLPRSRTNPSKTRPE
jgi:DNA-binding NarL/FixJ family response regulator